MKSSNNIVSRIIRIILLLILIGVCVISIYFPDKKKELPKAKETLLTENFVQKFLQKEDGRIKTNITDRSNEFLSESIGLWMEYLVAKNDYVQFDEQVEILKTYFLTKDNLVTWELQGEKKAPVNALIDDLRIIDALFTAGEKWNDKGYRKLAEKMSMQLVTYQTLDNLMIDLIDLGNKHQDTNLTLSYIIPSVYKKMVKNDVLPGEIYDATKTVLLEAPISNVGFFPKTYHVPTKKYIYDEEINLIDQLYVGYHRVQWDGDVSHLLKFIKKAYVNSDERLYGRYDALTGKPIVQYEAPGVYALAILMCLELEEHDFARELYKNMKKLQQVNESSPYNGGYIDIQSKETHSFDNLLALLAERRGIDEKIF